MGTPLLWGIAPKLISQLMKPPQKPSCMVPSYPDLLGGHIQFFSVLIGLVFIRYSLTILDISSL